MKAMVFAAGYGQRLRPATEKIPKALVPVWGRPMIEYPLRLLREAGITEVIINLHHLGEMIERELGNGDKLNIRIQYLREETLLDTGGGLLRARPLFNEETFIVINSDVMIDLRLNELIDFHQQHKAAATLVLRTDAKVDEYGAIETAADGRIHTFLGKRASRTSKTPLTRVMFTGVQVLEPRIFDYMEGHDPFSITKVTYPKMLLGGELLYGYHFRGFWQDLGTPKRIKEAETKLKSGAVKLHYL
ncbi:MAG: NTP transferase domain-containing protein [Deltaproteobacteria bacterium]|nr:NTP transferase domain-containing protein [Deltaproteobacteria bacterium]